MKKIIVDVGSGKASYLYEEARIHPENLYIAIDKDYDKKYFYVHDLPKLENIQHIAGDARFLPIKDKYSSVSTT